MENTTFPWTQIIPSDTHTIPQPRDIIAPVERIRMFSDEQFESFIAEWAVSCLKPTCKEVYNMGGSGDMGRDVIAEFQDGTCNYYQCKKYDHPLAPSDIYVEIGKICYYSYIGAILLPKKYRFVSPYDVGPKLSNLLKKPGDLKQSLISNWEKYCKKEISNEMEIELSTDFLAYIEDIDFSIFGCHAIHSIIEEYRKTNYFFLRFGSPTPPPRPDAMNPPDELAPVEVKYVSKAKRAFTLSKRVIPGHDAHEVLNSANQFVAKQRKVFYVAESLRQYARRVYLDDKVFEDLKDEIYSAVQDTVEMVYPDPLTRLRQTLTTAASANTQSNPLDYQFHAVRNDDRKGVCHHLVNDDRIDWEDSIDE